MHINTKIQISQLTESDPDPLIGRKHYGSKIASLYFVKVIIVVHRLYKFHGGDHRPFAKNHSDENFAMQSQTMEKFKLI